MLLSALFFCLVGSLPVVAPPVPETVITEPVSVAQYDQIIEKNGGSGKVVAGYSTDNYTDWARQVNQAVLSLDEGIGKIIAALKQTGQYDNTLIVFTSDQGFAWGQHGFQVKLAPYDSNILSPFVVSMPIRLPSGKVAGCR